MNKNICDICGTMYPETEDKCPTCGCSRDFGLDNLEEEFLDDAILGEAAVEEKLNQRKSKGIFDFDEVNQVKSQRDLPEEDEFDDDEEEEEAPRTNVGLVVVLLILIVLLLLTAGIFYLRYFLPNMTKPEQTEPIVTTEAVETEPAQNTELTIPCVNLSVPGGLIELGEGGKWLMNVQVFPADTTDAVIYSSSDEAVVTVSEDGTVTAVGEGTAQIIVSCGSRQISTNVVVDYSAGEETVSVAEIPTLGVEETTDGTETTAAGEETQAAEETQPQETTEATEGTEAAELVVKLKKTDISIFARYTSVTLELDCDLELTDLTWFTMDSTVAIVNDGVVTATGSGITRIYGDYGDQRVECIIRCSF